jgi:hypothetical protein
MSLKIDDSSGANRDAIRDMLGQICPEANLNVADDGIVLPTNPGFCTQILEQTSVRQHPTGCECICKIIDSSKTVTIRIREDLRAHGGGRTIAADNDKSVTAVGSDQIVEIENKNRYRQRRIDTREWMDVPDWLILAHELCGHAFPGINGAEQEWRPGKPGYRKNWHHASELIEDNIRMELGLPPRGAEHGVKP